MEFSTYIQGSFRRTLPLWVALVLCINTSALSAADTPSWTSNTQNGLFEIHLEPQSGEVEINALQNWIVSIKNSAGIAINPDHFFLDGGMKAHGHGLPTSPQLTDKLADGRYLIEGLRFNMVGAWTLIIGVEYKGMRDIANFELEIDY